MLRIQSIIDELTTRTETAALDCSYEVTSLQTIRTELSGSDLLVDQEYSALLTLDNLHKQRTYPAVCLTLLQWFDQWAQSGESYQVTSLPIDALHCSAQVALKLTEQLIWSPVLPAEEATIPLDERIAYLGVDYKQVQQAALVGI
ncbi:MAG: hypothetical protein RRB13_11830 [bacterium]|nr:hypothetical protein [bacterium]